MAGLRQGIELGRRLATESMTRSLLILNSETKDRIALLTRLPRSEIDRIEQEMKQ